ncbi:MAG: hypothetical protein H8E17_09655 [Deltaproteobacteria bacterium]|nr:hypothetical protein [Deltaproteobacteria bacterium]
MKTICENCNREMGSPQKPRRYDRHLVCPTCYTILMDSETKIHLVVIKDAIYAWLRIPAVLLGSIGLLGILAVQFESVGFWLSYFRMPSVNVCYLIAAVTGMVFVLSFTVVKKSERNDVIVGTISRHLHESWRSQ